MRCLTLWPEWLPAFLYMGKRVENRGCRPPASLIGQRLALHGGASIGGGSRKRGLRWLSETAAHAGWHVDQDLRAGQSLYFYPTGRREGHMLVRIPVGHVVATCRVVGAVRDSDSRWAIPGQWHWLLDDLQPLPTGPVPAKGKQGLWNWEPPATEPLPFYQQVLGLPFDAMGGQ